MRNLVMTFLLLIVGSANAGKVYMALVPTSSEFYAIVSIVEKPCVTGDGNAVYMSETRSGKSSALGCWKLEGTTVKVEWIDNDNVPKTFDFTNFKPISEEGPAVKKQGSKVQLNCVAPGWVSDILVERNEVGILNKLIVGGEDVTFTEKGTAINFSYKGKNFSLSTTTGIFNYETSGMQSFMNRQLGGRDVSGTGSCKLAESTKKF